LISRSLESSPPAARRKTACRPILDLTEGYGARTVAEASRQGPTLSSCARWTSIWCRIPVRETNDGEEVRADLSLTCRNEETPRWVRNVMNSIMVLLVASALVGLVLGLYFGLGAILISGVIIAISAAVILQNEGFGFLAGIAIIVVCLTVNQIAYLIGAALASRGPEDQ